MAGDYKTYDVIVIGAGISGLSVAAVAAESGLAVAVFTKEENALECNTNYAQGGIVETGEGDSPELLCQDIQKAGSYLNSVDAVRYVASDGPAIVREYLVEKAGVPFARTKGGKLDHTREAAHSIRRILYVKDYTGRSIEEHFFGYAKGLKGIDFFPSHTAVDVITNSHTSLDSQQRYRQTQAIGVYVLDQATGQIEPVFAGAVVLAAGGVGNVFLHTSNPKGATGDGIAMAHRAGCEIINAEFVQFHPTVLFHRDVKRFLISEALRGEGARLVNRRGEHFMKRHHPELQELAPRDEVARAIYREMGSDGSGYVFLDASVIPNLSLKERFPSIHETCFKVGIDIAKDPIPVVPAAHYFCGGIKTDLDGRTSVRGLYAVGENACNGVHGANRLASISLLESLAFGVRCGRYLSSHIKRPSRGLLGAIPGWVYAKNEEEFDDVLIGNDLVNIQTVMWNYVGIVRTRKRLSRALADLNYLTHRIENFYREAKVSRELLELRNAVLCASLVARAALSNQKSIGCHFLD